MLGTCRESCTLLTASKSAARSCLITAMQLQEQSLSTWEGQTLLERGGWSQLSCALLAHSQVLVLLQHPMASDAVSRSDGNVAMIFAVWDLMMCSMCKATNRAPLSSHVQDIFAA